MQYLVRFIYMDDKVKDVTMPKELLGNFFDSLNKKELYWNKDESQGIWTDLDKVRLVEMYAKINSKEEEKQSLQEDESPSESA